jgi:hypothetical protein
MTAASIPPFPTRSDEMPDATVDQLFDAYSRHLIAAVALRASDPAHLLAAHAVAALAIEQAIVDTFVTERWWLVRDGLAGGATAEEVGVALGGLEVSQVAAGLGSWADRQHRAGELSDVEHDAVLALITYAGGAR